MKKEKDPATKKLENEGLIKSHSKKRREINKEKIKEFGRITYDFWSGVKYIVVLSALLWWIPLFGPMLAGYVGGRRTGGPKKGLVASVVALFVIGFAYYILIYGFLSSHFTNFFSHMNAQVTAIGTHALLEPYTEFLRYYWSEFLTSITIGIPFGANNYVLTIIFAYIGGVLSLEKRKEYTDGVRSLDSVKDKVQKYAKVPSRGQRTPSAAPEKSLKNLEPVKVNHPKKEGRKGKKRPTAGDNEPLASDEGTNRENKVRSNGFQNRSHIEHHTHADGDDWQLL